MKVLKRYEILNSEGPIMVLNKHSDHWSLAFHGTRVHTIVDPSEMIAFLLSNGEITNDEKTYVYSNYSEGEKMDSLKLTTLLKELLDDHQNRWVNDEEYYNKYSKK